VQERLIFSSHFFFLSDVETWCSRGNNAAAPLCCFNQKGAFWKFDGHSHRSTRLTGRTLRWTKKSFTLDISIHIGKQIRSNYHWLWQECLRQSIIQHCWSRMKLTIFVWKCCIYDFCIFYTWVEIVVLLCLVPLDISAALYNTSTSVGGPSP